MNPKFAAAIGVSGGHPAINSGHVESKPSDDFSAALKNMLQRVIEKGLATRYQGHGDKFFRIDEGINFLIRCDDNNVHFIKDQVITALGNCFPNQNKQTFEKMVTSHCMFGTGRLSHVKIDVSDLKADIQKKYPDRNQVINNLNDFGSMPAIVVATKSFIK